MKRILSLILILLCITFILPSCKKDEASSDLNDSTTAPQPFSTSEISASADYEIPVIEAFTYDYDLTEYITLPDYMSLDFEYNKLSIDDAALEDALLYAKLSSPSVMLAETDREASDGDLVMFDYTSTFETNGESALSASDVTAIIGEDMFAPGFDAYIKGAAADQTLKFNFTFPSDWTNIASVSGKTLSFEVTVTSVKEVVLPTTEAIMAENGVATEEELYALLREGIEDNNAYYLLMAIISKSEVIKYPEKELEQHKAIFEDNIEARAKMMGTTVEGVIAGDYSGSMVKYKEEMQSYAESECKRDLVVYLLQDLYGFELSAEEYNICLEEYYEENHSAMGFQSIEDAHNNMGQALANSLFDELAASAVYDAVTEYVGG